MVVYRLGVLRWVYTSYVRYVRRRACGTPATEALFFATNGAPRRSKSR
jgi:hypothetical protein